MRRSLWGSIALAAAALLLLAAFAVVQSSRSLRGAEEASRARMRGLAEYVVEHLREDIFSYSFVLTPQSLPEDFLTEKSRWLGRLAAAAGLQRAALTDSAGAVYISSQASLPAGAPVRPHLLDSAGYDAARLSGRPVFARARSDVSRQSLYYPFDFFGNGHVLVLESDRDLLRQFEAYRGLAFGLAALLSLVLAALAAALWTLNRRVQAALAAAKRHEQLAFLGRTSAELAHELRNPLAVIKSSADVLRRKYDPERQEPAFRFLAEETMRLGRIIGNILGFSRDRKVETRPLLLADLAAAATESVAAQFSGVQVEWDIPPQAQVAADADAGRQVLENLLRNAAQAMNGQGRVAGRARPRTDGDWRLWVADEGPGIPPRLRKSLFDPFTTGSRTGTGLGLAIVRSLGESMGWRITLDEAGGAEAFPGRKIGACFVLDLPAAEKSEAGKSGKTGD